MQILSNIVSKDSLHETNLKALKIIRDSVLTSFGPYGSATQIMKTDAIPKFTKDGNTILKNIKFLGQIESSLADIMVDLTNNVVKEVGDGTTSATLLAYNIYKRFVTKEEPNFMATNGAGNIKIYDDELSNVPPVMIERTFKAIVKEINELIVSRAKEATPDDMYRIAKISTNGDEDLSLIIANIYKEMGNEVFITVKHSSIDEDYTRTYDGMTINTGYGDKVYVNNKEGFAELNHPQIYFFEDPVDTPEMIGYVQNIIMRNIMDPIKANDIKGMIPTVILCPRTTRDIDTTMDAVTEAIYKYRSAGIQIPFLFVPNITDKNMILDLARLCNATTIKKYVDLSIQEEEQKQGLAPTNETVHDFFGCADAVISDFSKTKIINPCEMYKQGTTEYSDLYQGMIDHAEREVAEAKRDGQDVNTLGTLKRRLNSLKANTLDLYIGGSTQEERDNRFDAAEDAVLNCMSAAIHGFGYASNLEGLFAAEDVYKKYGNAFDDEPTLEVAISSIIYNSYLDLVALLYGTKRSEIHESYSEYERNGIVHQMVVAALGGEDKLLPRMPIDITTGERSEDVVTSIRSDIAVLTIISKLMTILITCNQFLTPEASNNMYDAIREIEKKKSEENK